MSPQNDRNPQRPIEGRVSSNQSAAMDPELTFWDALLGWMNTVSTPDDRVVTYDSLTGNAITQHHSRRMAMPDTPELPNRPVPPNASPLLEGSIRQRLQPLQASEQKRLDATSDRNAKKQTLMNYLEKTLKRIQPENDQMLSMESYEPTRSLDAEALLRRQLNPENTAPELLEIPQKDYRQFVQRPLTAAEYLKSLQANVAIEPPLEPIELVQTQRNHKKSEPMEKITHSKSTHDKNQEAARVRLLYVDAAGISANPLKYYGRAFGHVAVEVDGKVYNFTPTEFVTIPAKQFIESVTNKSTRKDPAQNVYVFPFK